MALRDNHVVVTGAAGGLGRALCFELARAGARVSALELDTAALQSLVESDDTGRIRGTKLDITDAAACDEAFGRLRAEHGPVDCLFNNAGITHFSRVADVALETVLRVMDVNFTGAVHCTKAALPDLIARRGQLVVMSSVAGFAPLYGRCAYSASKHALHGFFETLRSEVAEHGVNVLIVCPSFVDSQRDHPDARSPYAGTARPGSARATVGEVISPESAARRIVAAASRRRRQLLVGRVAKQSYWARRIWPRLYDEIMLRSARNEFEI